MGDSWNRDRDLQKTRAFVLAAITVSQNINRFMIAYRSGTNLSNDWAKVRTELTVLAQTFNIPPIRWDPPAGAHRLPVI